MSRGALGSARAIRSWHVALGVGLLAAALMLARHQTLGSWTRFSVVTTQAMQDRPSRFRADALSGPGYDGMFFLALAGDPWPRTGIVEGIALDHPAYRHARIFYPLVARALAGGSPDAIPLALVLVNVLALALIAGCLAELAVRLGRSPWVGATVLVIPGLWMAAARDLAEPLTIALLAGAVLALLRGRSWLTALCLTLAVLTREDALLTVLALLPVAPAVAIGPVLVFGAWQLALAAHWGGGSFGTGASRLGLPGFGFTRAFTEDLTALARLASAPGAGIEAAVEIALAAAYLALLACAARSLWTARGSGQGGERAPEIVRVRRWMANAFVAWSAFALVLSSLVWEDDWAFTRVLTPAALAAVVLLADEGRRPPRALVAVGAALAALTFVRIVARV